MISVSNDCDAACTCGPVAIRSVLAALVLLVLSVTGCAVNQNAAPSAATPAAAAPIAAAPPRPSLPFNDAITAATEQMFQSFKMDGDTGSGPVPFVIDPLIDGATGVQSTATSYIQNKIIALTQARYTRFQAQPFTAGALISKPLVLIGTLNTVNKTAEMKGDRAGWWICIVLVDLKSGKVVAKGVALAQLDGVDHTPLEYFKDSPAWSEDDATSTYIKNCKKNKVGDVVDAKYLEGLYASSLIAQAIEAYDNAQYQQALDLYTTAATTPAGDQLRLYVGLYLTNQKLGNRDAEDEAFRRLVDFGLAHKRLAVKFLFRPGSTLLVNDSPATGPYNMWLSHIATESSTRDVCLTVTGHTTPTGLAVVNQELSVRRAEYIKYRLDTIEPVLTMRLVADGVGASENLIGTGKDDDSDALDRRVEFKVIRSDCGKPIIPEK